ncbi:relaxin-3-like [Oncorhynchus nerka]|uniref:relaxin-3-like n=1 Tax=Oncorhynchus nerka TaxID=8023 RepID=UPI0031B809E2
MAEDPFINQYQVTGEVTQHSRPQRDREKHLLQTAQSTIEESILSPPFLLTRSFTSWDMMWKPLVLAVCLLVAGVQGMERPTYGVKLCGREFIRAVIFTCGGSRWRRSLGSAGDFPQDPFSSHDEDSPEGWNSDSQVPEGPFQHVQEGGVFISRPARSLISEEILEALRMSDRKGRDVVVGLSNACCKWGCSKGDISSLC